jgi:hypothetical protein
MAERYGKELRPSQAGRFRLDASIRPAREEPGATCVAHAPTPAPGSAPPPGRAHLR